MGWIGRKFIATMTFTGGAIQMYSMHGPEQVVLPKLPSGATVVMDHAALGKRSAKTKELIESAGCRLLYLPTYAYGSQSYRALLAYHKKLN